MEESMNGWKEKYLRNEAENRKSLKEKCGGRVINYLFIIVRYFISFNFLFQLKKGRKDEKKNLLTLYIYIYLKIFKK